LQWEITRTKTALITERYRTAGGYDLDLPPLQGGTQMKNKSQIIKKATAALLPLLLIFSLTGAAIPGGLNFTIKETVIVKDLDFTYTESGLAANMAPSFYKDTDGSFVIWWQDSGMSSYTEISEDDKNYDITNNQYLIRVYPGKPEKTVKKEIREWIDIQTEPRRVEFVFPSGMWQNKSGNTVLLYMGFLYDEADETIPEPSGYEYTFEEYDKDFKLIKKVVHKAVDLPGGDKVHSQNFAEKDKDDNYYIAVGDQVDVYNTDFKFLGAVTDIPANTSDLYDSKGKDTFLMVNTGGDGAVYTYWYEAEMRKVYKIDPRKQTSKYAFDVSLEESVWLYTGKDNALFYGVGVTLNAIDADGKIKPVLEWGTNGIAPYFSNNDFSMNDIANYESGTLCFYSKNGNFYNFNIEDKDGDSKTTNDKQLVLYEFIRK
jgi:hypothetical protein